MLIFISHATIDDEFVDNLRADLERYGFETWVDHHNAPPPGTLWDEYLDIKLRECEIMILIWSPFAGDSQNVGAEWREFYRQRKTIVPIKVREAPLPLLIRDLQYVDFTNPLSYDAQFQKLRSALPLPSLAVTQQKPVTDLQESEYELGKLKAVSDDLVDAQKPAIRDNQILFVFPNMSPMIKIISLDREKLFIGRGRNVDIDLNDCLADEHGISRQHAMLIVSKSGLSLMDLNSINGTYIERHRLTSQIPYPLKNDSLIRLGMLVIRVFFKSVTE